MAVADILHACLETGDEVAWRAFIARFQPLIAGSVSRVVRRYGSSNPALVDDLVQETYLRLCKNDCQALRSFEAQHDEAIFGYLKVIATSVALDHFRALATSKRKDEVADDDDHPEASTSPDAIEQSALLNEVDRRLVTTESERDRTIFWLHHRHGYSAREIASMPALGLTQKGVESCLHRLKQALCLALGSRDEVVKGKSWQTTLGVNE